MLIKTGPVVFLKPPLERRAIGRVPGVETLSYRRVPGVETPGY
jgi:hypothetical protein